MASNPYMKYSPKWYDWEAKNNKNSSLYKGRIQEQKKRANLKNKIKKLASNMGASFSGHGDVSVVKPVKKVKSTTKLNIPKSNLETFLDSTSGKNGVNNYLTARKEVKQNLLHLPAQLPNTLNLPKTPLQNVLDNALGKNGFAAYVSAHKKSNEFIKQQEAKKLLREAAKFHNDPFYARNLYNSNTKGFLAQFYESYTTKEQRRNPMYDPFSDDTLRTPFEVLLGAGLKSSHANNIFALNKDYKDSFTQLVLNILYKPYYKEHYTPNEDKAAIFNTLSSERYFTSKESKLVKDYLNTRYHIQNAEENTNYTFYAYDKDKKVVFRYKIPYTNTSKTSLDYEKYTMEPVINPKILPRNLVSTKSLENVFNESLVMKDINSLSDNEKQAIIEQRDLGYELNKQALERALYKYKDINTDKLSVSDITLAGSDIDFFTKTMSNATTNPTASTVLNVLNAIGLDMSRVGAGLTALTLEQARINNRSISQQIINGRVVEDKNHIKDPWDIFKQGFTYKYNTDGSKHRLHDVSFTNYFLTVPNYARKDSSWLMKTGQAHPMLTGMIMDFLSDPLALTEVVGDVAANASRRVLYTSMYDTLEASFDTLTRKVLLNKLPERSVKRTSKQIVNILLNNDIKQESKSFRIQAVLNNLVGKEAAEATTADLVNVINHATKIDALQKAKLITKNSTDTQILAEARLKNRLKRVDTSSLTQKFNIASVAKETTNKVQQIDNALTKAVATTIGVYPAIAGARKATKALSKIKGKYIISTAKQLEDRLDDAVRSSVKDYRTQNKIRLILSDNTKSLANTCKEVKTILKESVEVDNLIDVATKQRVDADVANIARSLFHKRFHDLKIILNDELYKVKKGKTTNLDWNRIGSSFTLANINSVDSLKEALLKSVEEIQEQIYTEAPLKYNNSLTAQSIIDEFIVDIQFLCEKLKAQELNPKYTNLKIELEQLKNTAIRKTDTEITVNPIIFNESIARIEESMSGLSPEIVEKYIKLNKSRREQYVRTNSTLYIHYNVTDFEDLLDTVDALKKAYTVEIEDIFPSVTEFEQALFDSNYERYGEYLHQQANVFTEDMVGFKRNEKLIKEAERNAERTVYKYIKGLLNDELIGGHYSRDILDDSDKFIHSQEALYELIGRPKKVSSKHPQHIPVSSKVFIKEYGYGKYLAELNKAKVTNIPLKPETVAYAYKPKYEGINLTELARDIVSDLPEGPIYYFDYNTILHLPLDVQEALTELRLAKEAKTFELDLNHKLYASHYNYVVQAKSIIDALPEVLDGLADSNVANEEIRLLIRDAEAFNYNTELSDLNRCAQAIRIVDAFNTYIDTLLKDPKKASIAKDIIYNYKEMPTFGWDYSTRLKEHLQEQLIMKYSSVMKNDRFRDELLAPDSEIHKAFIDAGVSEEDLITLISNAHTADADAILTALRIRYELPIVAKDLDKRSKTECILIYDLEATGESGEEAIAHEIGIYRWHDFENSDNLKTIVSGYLKDLESSKNKFSIKRGFTLEEIKNGRAANSSFIKKMYGTLDKGLKKLEKDLKEAKNIVTSEQVLSAEDMAVQTFNELRRLEPNYKNKEITLVGFNNHKYDDLIMSRNEYLKEWFDNCNKYDAYELLLSQQDLLWTDTELEDVLRAYKTRLFEPLYENGSGTLKDIHPQNFLNKYEALLRNLQKDGQDTTALLNDCIELRSKLREVNSGEYYHNIYDYNAIKFDKENFFNSMYQLYYKTDGKEIIARTLFDEDPDEELMRLLPYWSTLDEASIKLNVPRLSDLVLNGASLEEVNDLIHQIKVLTGNQPDNIMRLLNPLNGTNIDEYQQLIGVNRFSDTYMNLLFGETYNNIELVGKTTYIDLMYFSDKIRKKVKYSNIPYSSLAEHLEENPNFLNDLWAKQPRYIEVESYYTNRIRTLDLATINWELQDLQTRAALVEYSIAQNYNIPFIQAFNNLRDLTFKNTPEDIVPRQLIETMTYEEMDTIIKQLFGDVDDTTLAFLEEVFADMYLPKSKEINIYDSRTTSKLINECIDSATRDINELDLLSARVSTITGTDSVHMHYEAMAECHLQDLYSYIKNYTNLGKRKFYVKMNMLTGKAEQLHTERILKDLLSNELRGRDASLFLKRILINDSHPGVMFIKYRDSAGVYGKLYEQLKNCLDSIPESELYIHNNIDKGYFEIALLNSDKELDSLRTTNFRTNNELYRLSKLTMDDFNNLIDSLNFDTKATIYLKKAYANLVFLNEGQISSAIKGYIGVNKLENWLQYYFDNSVLDKLAIGVPENTDFMPLDFVHTIVDETLKLENIDGKGNFPLKDLRTSIRALAKNNVDRTNTMLYFFEARDLLGLEHLYKDCGFTKEELIRICNNNSDLVPVAMFEDAPNRKRYDILQKQLRNTEDIKKIQNIQKELSNLSLVRVQQMDINNIKDLDFAMQYKMVLMPVQVYETMFSDLNYFTAGPLVKCMQKYMSIMKGSYLASIATGFRNYIDEQLKTANDIGWDNMPMHIRNNIVAMRDYIVYKKMMKYAMKQSRSAKVSNAWLTNNFNYLKSHFREFKDLSNILSREDFLRMNTFINYGASGGTQAATLRAQKLFQSTGEFNISDVFNKPIKEITKSDVIESGKSALEGLRSIPFLPLQVTEEISRYAHHLTLKELGITGSEAFGRISHTHFNFDLKSRTDVYMELVIPFYSFLKMNAEYWCDEIVANPRLLRQWSIKTSKLLQPELKDYEEDLMDGNFANPMAINSIARGNLPLNFPWNTHSNDQDIYLKLNPSIMDALNMFANPINQLYSNTFAPFKAGLEHTEIMEAFIEQGLFEQPYIGNTFHDLIPFLGSWYEYRKDTVGKIMDRTFTKEGETYCNTLLGAILSKSNLIKYTVPGFLQVGALDLTSEDVINLYRANGYVYDKAQLKYVKKEDAIADTSEKMLEFCKQNKIDYDSVSKQWVPYGMGDYTNNNPSLYWTRKVVYQYEHGLVWDYVSSDWQPINTPGIITDYYEYQKRMIDAGYEKEYFTKDGTIKWVRKGEAQAHSIEEAAELYRIQGKAYDYITKEWVPSSLAKTEAQALKYWYEKGYVYDNIRNCYVKAGTNLGKTKQDYYDYMNSLGLVYDLERKTWVHKGEAIREYGDWVANSKFKWHNYPKFDTFEDMADYMESKGKEWDPIKKTWVKLGNAPTWEEYEAFQNEKGFGWNPITKSWVPLSSVPTFNEYQKYMASKGLEWDTISKAWVAQGTALGTTWQDYQNYSRLHNLTYDYASRKYTGSYISAAQNKKAAAQIFKVTKGSVNYTDGHNNYIYNLIRQSMTGTMPEHYTKISRYPVTLNMLQHYPTRYKRLSSRGNAARYIANPRKYLSYYDLKDKYYGKD